MWPGKEFAQGMEAQGTRPKGMQAQGTGPRGMEAQGTGPRGMEAQGTGPKGMEAQGTEPRGMEGGAKISQKEWKREARIFLRNRGEARISTRNGKPRPGFFSGIGRGGQKKRDQDFSKEWKMEARIFQRNGKGRPGFP